MGRGKEGVSADDKILRKVWMGKKQSQSMHALDKTAGIEKGSRIHFSILGKGEQARTRRQAGKLDVPFFFPSFFF